MELLRLKRTFINTAPQHTHILKSSQDPLKLEEISGIKLTIESKDDPISILAVHLHSQVRSQSEKATLIC